MDFEQIRRSGRAMRADAAAMVEENNAILAHCRRIQGRIASPRQRESELRIQLGRSRVTLAALVRPQDRARMEVRIARIGADLACLTRRPTPGRGRRIS